MSVIDQLRTLHDRMAARQPELARAGGVSFTVEVATRSVVSVVFTADELKELAFDRLVQIIGENVRERFNLVMDSDLVDRALFAEVMFPGRGDCWIDHAGVRIGDDDTPHFLDWALGQCLAAGIRITGSALSGWHWEHPDGRASGSSSGACDEAAVQALMACYAPPNVNAPEGPALDHQWRCAVERAIRDEYAIESARVSPAPGG